MEYKISDEIIIDFCIDSIEAKKPPSKDEIKDAISKYACEDDSEIVGLDILKEKLIERGMTKAQANSRAVAEALSVIAGDDRVVKFNEYGKELDALTKDLNSLYAEKESLEKSITSLYIKRRDAIKFIEDHDHLLKIQDIEDRINNFENTLYNAETKESADILRKAQLFIQKSHVDTKYDNTAFIIGLAAILSSGNIAPIEELSKINTDIRRIYPRKAY